MPHWPASDFVFVHIPKTGGSSISYELSRQLGRADLNGGLIREAERAARKLRAHWWRHLGAAELQSLLDSRWPVATKLSCVRNPWDRMVSWYHFWTQSRWVAFAVPEVASRIKAYRDFDHCLTAERRLPSPQCASLFDDAGNPLVENILRFENLQEDFNRLMPQLGLLPATLGRINVSRHRHYRDYYNSKTKRIMAEQYYDDIEQLDYRF